MKSKIFFPLLTMAVSLGSCSQIEEIPSNALDSEIVIEATADNTSRAVTSYCQANLPEEFMLSASLVSTNQTYIPAAKVIKSGNAYVFEGESRFWPADALKVVAYHNDNGTYAAGKFVNFTVNPNAEDQVDLIYAINPNAKEDDGAIKLNFRHALCQVAFKLSLANPNLQVDCRNISIGGISNSGTYTLPLTEESTPNWIDEGHNREMPDSDTPALSGRGQWSVNNTNSVFTVNFGNGKRLTTSSGTTTILLTYVPEGHVAVEGSNDQDWSRVMVLMPQKTPAWDPQNPDAGGAYFALDFKISNIDSKSGITTTVYDGIIYVPANVDWQQSTRYVYNLHIGNGSFGYTDLHNPQPSATPVSVTLSVDDFLPEHDDINTDTEDLETKEVAITYIMPNGNTQTSRHDAYLYSGHWHVVCPTSEHVLVPEGCQFLGWSTIENSTEPMAAPGEAICLKNFTAESNFASVNLYPVFVKYFTVHYRYNTGDKFSTPQYTRDIRYIAPSAAETLAIIMPDYFSIISSGPSQAKYNFLGWRYDVSSTTAPYWAPGQILTLTEQEVTLYSKWIAK